ncbi:uncharacterized protein LOC133885084 isoform X2 [Phragmites australis]|uniref:uncharacterized protein LOC133885084 isoform X2 n=1 Tax=Phragmites australis TaxID=29695 RepID=UPI002D7716F4|nr:uncharacterized protein LOC133885084 isoform X2 [Phragmites australis]
MDRPRDQTVAGVSSAPLVGEFVWDVVLWRRGRGDVSACLLAATVSSWLLFFGSGLGYTLLSLASTVLLLLLTVLFLWAKAARLLNRYCRCSDHPSIVPEIRRMHWQIHEVRLHEPADVRDGLPEIFHEMLGQGQGLGYRGTEGSMTCCCWLVLYFYKDLNWTVIDFVAFLPPRIWTCI